MKEVDVLGTLLGKYTNGEMIHFTATQLNGVVSAIAKDPTPEGMLKQVGALIRINEYLRAVDEKMNKTPKNNATVA